MPLFPMFVDLTGQDCLIAGGGTVALRKAEKLLPYGPRLTVIAPEVCNELCALEGVEICRRAVRAEDFAGRALVIAATDDRALNHRISALCREEKIPVNAVDDPEACSFQFPALVREGALSVGISTGGASPTGAIWLKRSIQKQIPPGFDELLRWLENLRPRIKGEIPQERVRAKVFGRLFEAGLAAGRPLTEEETEAIVNGERTEETP